MGLKSYGSILQGCGLICPDMIWMDKSQMVIYTPDTPNHQFQMDMSTHFPSKYLETSNDPW